ncbi:GspE/PulE family protein [Planctomycetota bacterium]
MSNLLLSVADVGHYISAVKLVVFLVLYFPSLALVGWVYRDARAIGTNETLWTAVIAGVTFVTALLLFTIPFFVAGVGLFIIGVAATGLAYVKHRNALVLDFEKVLTIDHLKGLISGQGKDSGGLDEYQFISTHGNEVPLPDAKTPDFFGYRSAYDIMTTAISQRVESLRMVPSGEVYKVTAEIDGASMPRPDIAKEEADYFVRYVKLLADLDVKERRKPQTGDFKLRKTQDTFEWEVKTAGSTAGEQLLFKCKGTSTAFRLNEIGTTSDQVEGINGFTKLKQGVFLITGPKRSGLSGTFYAMLQNHDAYTNNINTLEKEVLFSMPSVTQEIYSMSDTATMTYAKKLEQVVRMGPDIVGVAECVDAETAKVVCKAAADGKLVYVVLHAESVVQALGKWLKLVGDRNAVAETLLGISNQRLLRVLCEECKQGYTPNQDVLKKFNLPADKAKVLYRPGKVIYSKRGKESICENCQGTGFRGRTGIFEMIVINDALRKVIREAKALPEIATQFRRAKMLYLQEQALRKVMAGVTAINEMVRILSSGKTPNKGKPTRSKST